MSHTRTGNFGIGFRRFGGEWQKDLGELIAWAQAGGFACLDVKGVEAVQQVAASGLAVGSADLPNFKALLDADEGRRNDAVAEAEQYIRDCSPHAKNFFTVMLPGDKDRPRKDNFALVVEVYARLARVLEQCDARVVIEGWPGPGCLCCTPETIRALFKEVPSPAMAINYDPSHLIRMGIDPLRFLDEFAGRVGHVHGKDTEMLDERLYELGTEQPPALAEGVRWGGNHWRYTIPGHGQMRWGRGFAILAEAGYDGLVSIEMEDLNFNGAEESEKHGLLLAKSYLESC